MSTIWRDGKEIDVDDYIHQRERMIAYNEQEIDNLQKVEKFISEAIEEHFKKVYKTLDKTLEEYGGLEGLREMYGYGGVTKAKFDKIATQQEEREKLQETLDMTDITSEIKKSISARETSIRNYQSQIDEIKRMADDHLAEE